MPSASSQTVNLGLPAVPEVSDPKLFPEFIRIYNAINLLSTYLDRYTSDGQSTVDITNLSNAYNSFTAPHFHVTTDLTVDAKFGCNGKIPQSAFAFTITPLVAPAGNIGTAAGAWDTAANRDLAINTINALVTSVAEIKTALSNIGISV